MCYKTVYLRIYTGANSFRLFLCVAAAISDRITLLFGIILPVL